MLNFLMRTTKTDQTAQADLSLRWAHMSRGTFSHVVAHINVMTLPSYHRRKHSEYVFFVVCRTCPR